MPGISRRDLGKGLFIGAAFASLAACANFKQNLPIWLTDASSIVTGLVGIVSTDPNIDPATLAKINAYIAQANQVAAQMATAIQNGTPPSQLVQQFANAVNSAVALLPADSASSVAVSAVLVLLAGVLSAVGAAPASAIPMVRHPMSQAQARRVLANLHR